MMVKRKPTRTQKLVTVVTPVGYLTTTPKIAKAIIAKQKSKQRKTKKRK